MSNFNYTGKDNLEVMLVARNYNRAIFNWIKQGTNQNHVLLDFGAGRGEYCNRFGGFNITAVELDKELHSMIACRAYTAIEESNQRFDLIYSINVLEHIKDDNGMVSTFHHYLNNYGKVKVFIPAREELYSKMDEKVGHFRRYNKQQLAKLFINNGFKVRYCKYFDFLGWITTFIYKIVNNTGNINERTIKIYDKYIFPISRFLDIITLGTIIGKNLILEAQKID